MDQVTLILFASSPLVIITVLIIGFKLPAKLAMPLGLLLTLFVALLIWGMPFNVVFASCIQGLAITMDILIIILGALALLNTLKYSGALQVIRQNFSSLSPDYRIQLIIISWLFGSFLEGAAGFGTPAAIVAPLLVSIGYPVGAALLAGMMTMSTAVTFGAIGTPILIGVGEGLGFEGNPVLEGQVDLEQFIQIVTRHSGLIHAAVGTFMPVLMVLMVSRFYHKEKGWRESLNILPFLLVAGLSFTIPYMLTAFYLGPEFPSIIGAAMGLLTSIFFVKNGWLVPKDVHTFNNTDFKTVDTASHSNLDLLIAWTPYLLLGIILVISRMEFFPLGSLLKSFNIRILDIFGSGIGVNSYPFYLPGAIMLFISIHTMIYSKMKYSAIKGVASSSFKSLLSASAVLIFTLPMVRVFINSGLNNNDNLSMPIAIASSIANYVGDLWLVFAPIVGAFGAFIAGSNTISNLTFVQFQYNMAIGTGYNPALIVSMQAVGAAAGNMIAIHNVVAASATVGLVGTEGKTIRKTILPTLYYLASAILCGWILSIIIN